MGSVALCWGFVPISGWMMSSAMRSLVLVFMTWMHATWSRMSACAFLRSSSVAFLVMRTVAVAWRSSTVRMVCCFDSRFSLIMQIILSLVLGGDLRASMMGIAALTSILCLRSFSRRLKRSWK